MHTVGTFLVASSLQISKLKVNICTLSGAYCTDVEYGRTFWNILPNDVCNFNEYEVIYEGPANKTYDNTTDNFEILYSLTTEDITFVLTERKRKPFWSYILI